MSSAITPLTPLSASAVPPSSPRAAETPEKIKDAASQFEALLMAQMLRSVREAGSDDWGGSTDDESGASMLDLAEEQLARLMASRGGLGLAKLVINGLSRKELPADASQSTPSPTT